MSERFTSISEREKTIFQVDIYVKMKLSFSFSNIWKNRHKI